MAVPHRALPLDQPPQQFPQASDLPLPTSGDVSPASPLETHAQPQGSRDVNTWVMSPRNRDDAPDFGPIRRRASSPILTASATPAALPVYASTAALQLAQPGGGSDGQMTSVTLSGAGISCELCQQTTHDVWSCAACRTQGHRQCLGISFVAGFSFCQHCAPSAQAAYQRHTDEQRARWLQSLSASMASWRSAIMSTSGVAATVGLAAGAATGAAIAGAAAMVHGAASGTVAALSQVQRVPSEARLPAVEDLPSQQGGPAAAEQQTNADAGVFSSAQDLAAHT